MIYFLILKHLGVQHAFNILTIKFIVYSLLLGFFDDAPKTKLRLDCSGRRHGPGVCCAGCSHVSPVITYEMNHIHRHVIEQIV